MRFEVRTHGPNAHLVWDTRLDRLQDAYSSRTAAQDRCWWLNHADRMNDTDTTVDL